MGKCVLPFSASSEAGVLFNRTTAMPAGMPSGIDPGYGHISAAFYIAQAASAPAAACSSPPVGEGHWQAIFLPGDEGVVSAACTIVAEFPQTQLGFAKLCDEVARFHPGKTVIKAAGSRHMLAYDALRLRGASVACSACP